VKQKQERARKETEATPRTANRMRMLMILFAGILGLLVLMVVTSSTDAVYVVRANAAIPAMQEVNPSMFEAVSIEPDYVEPDTFTGNTPEQALQNAQESLENAWTVLPVARNQQLRPSMFAPTGTLTTPLAADERLISISARAARAVAGNIKTGDRVDIYVTAGEGLTALLAANIEIVSINIQAEYFDSLGSNQLNNPDVPVGDIFPNEPIPGTYVVRVQVDQVSRFISANSSGELYISLRGPNATETEGIPLDILDTICGLNPQAPACVRTGVEFPDVNEASEEEADLEENEETEEETVEETSQEPPTDEEDTDDMEMPAPLVE